MQQQKAMQKLVNTLFGNQADRTIRRYEEDRDMTTDHSVKFNGEHLERLWTLRKDQPVILERLFERNLLEIENFSEIAARFPVLTGSGVGRVGRTVNDVTIQRLVRSIPAQSFMPSQPPSVSPQRTAALPVIPSPQPFQKRFLPLPRQIVDDPQTRPLPAPKPLKSMIPMEISDGQGPWPG